MTSKHQRSKAPRGLGVPAGSATAAASIKSEHASVAEEEGSVHAPEPRRWLYAVIPGVLALLTSLNALWNGFASDDTQQVLGNVFIKSMRNLPLAFTSSVWSFVNLDISMTAQPYYRPMFSVLFMINHALFGTSAIGWHLANVLIHVAATLLVYLVCKEITGNKRTAAIAASLFAVHPTHAESVAWISGVTDPLMALFLLPAFYFYLRYKKNGWRMLMAFALALYLLALWSKETAVALPLIIAYCELFHFEESGTRRERIVRLLTLMALFALPTALYFLTRHNAIGAFLGQSILRYPIGPALASIPQVTVKYLALLAVPVGYSYQHYLPFVSSLKSFSFIAPLALLITLALAVAVIPSRALRLSGVWLLVLLGPVLANLRHFDAQYQVQERYLYLSSMGFCLGLALGIEWLAGRGFFRLSGRAVATALTAILVIAFGAAYVAHNRVWDDTLSVFQNAVAVEPNSAEAHSALGGTYYSFGWPRKAETEVRKALELDPKCGNAYLNMSYFSTQQGNLDNAIEYLEQAISEITPSPRTNSNLATIHLNLGLLYAQRKDIQRAEQNTRKSIELWPRAVGWYYTGTMYFQLERYEESLAMYEEVTHHVPRTFAPIQLSLGAVYERLNRKDEARAAYSRYLDLAPQEAPEREGVLKRIGELRGGAPDK